MAADLKNPNIDSVLLTCTQKQITVKREWVLSLVVNSTYIAKTQLTIFSSVVISFSSRAMNDL